MQKAFTAQSHKKGLEQAQGIVATYREQFPEAMKCLATDLEEVLTALRFPESHRKRIRTTNVLERLFGEGQRRAKVIPRFMNERSGLSLMFAVLVDASASWRGVKSAPPSPTSWRHSGVTQGFRQRHRKQPERRTKDSILTAVAGSKPALASHG
jgi:transposase-like protein